MTHLTIISVGTLKEDYLKDAVSEYKKRLSQYAKVEEINIKEEIIKNEDSMSEISRALDAEAEKIISAMPKDAYKIALCVEGKTCSSEQLADLVAQIPQEGKGEIVLIIGSSHGLAPEVKAACTRRLSISPMTFPHQMMRVILAEQFYRAHKICANENYHK